MSLVHKSLRRDVDRDADGDQAVPGAGGALDSDEFEREVARKEQMLKEGIRQLEEQIERLTTELEKVNGELQKEREDNLRLRQGMMSDRMGPRPPADEGGPSLLSRALE